MQFDNEPLLSEKATLWNIYLSLFPKNGFPHELGCLV